jgi:hypothetical protein
LRRKFPNRKKPGFPLQVLGFAHANPVGFPLQSRMHGRAEKLHTQFFDQPLAQRQLRAKARQLPGCGIASALNLYIRQELFRASCPESLLSKTRLRVRLLGHGNSAALTMRSLGAGSAYAGFRSKRPRLPL